MERLGKTPSLHLHPLCLGSVVTFGTAGSLLYVDSTAHIDYAFGDSIPLCANTITVGELGMASIFYAP